MAKLVSKTYGDALFEVAAEDGKMDVFYEEVKELLDILSGNQELARLMAHPKIVKEEKVIIIENVFKGRLSDEIVGLMTMLVMKGHFREMESVFFYFIEAVKESKKIGTAYVTSALELSQKQKDAVVAKLIETTRYEKFDMYYDTDAALIGGMVIRIGDRVVDNSIRTRLLDMTRELSKIQLKVGECAS